jgi:hypothetical protein
MLQIGTKVRFVEPFRPDAIAPSAVGIVVLIEPLPTMFGPPQRLRAKFGGYISPWLMPAQLEAVEGRCGASGSTRHLIKWRSVRDPIP